MKLSQLKIEPHLIEAFLSHLKSHGFVVTQSKSDTQPHWINHSSLPNHSHITEVDKFGNLIIPTGLLREALEFLCVSKKA